MTNAPDWICNLKKGDELVIVFPFTGNAVFAIVVQNDPPEQHKTTFSTITVKYVFNKVEKEEDLLYDDYSKDENYQNAWHAHPVT